MLIYFGCGWDISCQVLQNQVKTFAVTGRVVIEGYLSLDGPIRKRTTVSDNIQSLQTLIRYRLPTYHSLLLDVVTSVGSSVYSFVLSTATILASNSLVWRTIQFSAIVICTKLNTNPDPGLILLPMFITTHLKSIADGETN